MLKLMRVVKIKKIIKKFQDRITSDSTDLLVTFFSITVKILIVAHYMGCWMFYTGMEELRTGRQGWIISQELVDSSFEDRYITSMYWAFTTMSAVGYGEIVPITPDEKLVVMVMMLASCGVFAYTVNSIGNIVSKYNHVNSLYRERMMYTNQFMADKNMPRDLRLKVRRYMDYIYENKKQVKVDENEVFHMLNENLKDKINMHIRGVVLNKIKFFEPFGIDFLSDLTEKFSRFTYVTDDFLFMEGDKSEAFFYIKLGKIAMIHKKSHTFVKDLGSHSYFGELGFLTGKERCLSAKARDFTEVYVLRKDVFEKIYESYIQAI